ncbi:hypothetical protein NW759_014261 [Fusarium solani]|nr:hypothetical protein NW759_014261 [Fusarium solani]
MSSSQQTPSNSGHGQSSGSMSHTQDGADASQAQGEAHQARNGAAQAQEDAPLGQADRFQGWIGQVQGRRLIERLLSPPNNGPENSGPR